MNGNRVRKWVSVFAMAALLALLWAVPARAFEGRGGDVVTIPAGEEVADDLYVGTGTFTLDGRVNGDLVVFGATITIGPQGVVEGDLIAAGQSVIVRGQVMDDARLAGFALTIEDGAQVGGDVVAGAYSLETGPGSAIAGDAIYAGGQALHAGNIAGDAEFATGGLEVRGSVEGDLNAEVGAASNTPMFSPSTFVPNTPPVPPVRGGLTVAEGAVIGGNLRYAGADAANIPEGAVAGQVFFEQRAVTEREQPNPIVEWFFNNLRTLVTLIVVGLLMIWLVPNFTRRSAAALRERPLLSLGWGIVSFFAFLFALLALAAVVIILAIVLGVVTLGDLVGTTIWGGLLAGFALIFTFSVAVGYLSKVVVSYLGGRLILAQLRPEWAESRIWPVVLGVLIFTALAAIPLLGWLFSLVVILFGLGALWLTSWERLRPRPAGPPAAA